MTFGDHGLTPLGQTLLWKTRVPLRQRGLAPLLLRTGLLLASLLIKWALVPLIFAFTY